MEANAGPNSSLPNPANVEASPALRVLLVDDHEDTNRSMMLLLRRRGYLVKTASDIAQAIELFAQEPFDVLVSDMGLPDGSGLDLLAKLGDNQPRYGGIVVSGYSMEEDMARSRAAGYKEHLSKPVDVNKLESVIRQVAGLPLR